MTVENEKAIVENKEFDCIRYCDKGANRFVLQRYIPQINEYLCLHQDTIEQEINEMQSFLKSCHWVLLTYPNGHSVQYPLSDFSLFSTCELEHNNKNIIISLTKDLRHSFVYTTDSRGEMVDKQPISNITIF